MSTIKLIKRRIKAARNISQITKAMEMVAAAKMRKAQVKALSSRPYALKLDTVLKRMSVMIDPSQHLLLQVPPLTQTNVIAIVVVSPDKGLCGSLNSNLSRELEELETTLSDKHPDIPLSFEYVAVGKKLREYILATGKVLHAEFTHFPDRPAFEDTLPISRLLLDGFRSLRFYKVYLLYTDFLSTLSQKPAYTKLLPIETEELTSPSFEIDTSTATPSEYVFEPDTSTILDWLLPYYFELQVYQTILEAQASEHSARMVAMRNASDNAADILKYLNLDYNRKRQSQVTSEIADIVTSRMAVS